MFLWLVTKLCWRRKLPSGCCSSPVSHQAFPSCRLPPPAALKAKDSVRETQRRSLAEKHTLTSSISIRADRETACSIFTLFTNNKHLTHTCLSNFHIPGPPPQKKTGLGEQQITQEARGRAGASSSAFTNVQATDTQQGNAPLRASKRHGVNSYLHAAVHGLFHASAPFLSTEGRRLKLACRIQRSDIFVP